jgi:RimJ/RimL family protein N-acetyltransferase
MVTPRAVLRAWRVEDGPLLKTALDHNREHLTPWVPWATGEVTPLAEVNERVALFAADFVAGRNWLYAVMSPDETQVIGGTGLHNRVGPGGLEVGYWIDRDHINRGLATEVAGAVTATGFGWPTLEYLEMHVDARNGASARVPERLGYTLAEVRDEPSRPGSSTVVSMMIWRMRREER